MRTQRTSQPGRRELADLRELRAQLYEQMTALCDRATNERRDLTAAEAREFDEAAAEFDRITKELARFDRVRDLGEFMSRAVAAPDTEEPGSAGSRDSLGAWFAQETRGLLEGSGSGSYIVPEEFLPRVWDRLAAESVGLASGFTVIETERDELHIPRLTADAAAAWVAEGATISATDPTLNETLATPRKLAVLTQASNELIADSNPAVLDVLLRNHLRSLALKFDLGAFEGSGTAPEIRGLKNVVGIGSVSLGANGSTPANLDPWADAIGTLEQANAEATAIVMHPRTWATLIKIKETSGSAKPVLQESAGSGAQGIERRLYGVPVFLTSQLSIAETQGTSSDCSSAYVYEASEVVVVRRQEARIEVDRSRLFNQDMSEVRGILRMDLVVPNPAAVVRILGIRP
jgi:HK97 family phage major capsid protein